MTNDIYMIIAMVYLAIGVFLFIEYEDRLHRYFTAGGLTVWILFFPIVLLVEFIKSKYIISVNKEVRNQLKNIIVKSKTDRETRFNHNETL